MNLRTQASLIVVPLLFAFGCTTAEPLVPTQPTTVGTPNVTGVAAEGTLKVTEPTPTSPTNDVKVARAPVTLSANEARGIYQSTAGVQLFYRFQVFGPNGGLVQDSGVVSNPNFSVSATMDDSARHTWRVRAESGPFASNWSPTASFLAPNPRPCGPPNHVDPFSIIHCQVDEYYRQYGTLHGYLELVMLDVAIDLNRAGVPGGPFGRLVKTTGNNCGGYSCDIICAGQGGGQRQYDILLDERIPLWGAPSSGGDIRVDTCEIP
jgi:hypothetical protein